MRCAQPPLVVRTANPEQHDDFSDYIADEARAKVKELHAAAAS